MRSHGFLLGEMIVLNHIDQRLVDPDAAVVFDKTELAKAIHEEADAGPGGADHLCQRLLRDLGNQRFRLARLAKLGHQQENSRQTLFTSLAILTAEQTSIAVAVARCSPPTLASDSSPMNSPGERIAMVASLPSGETTAIFTRPVRR